MRLDEAAIRAKLIELLDGCNQTRMDMWMISGVTAGVLDPDTVERVMREEIDRRTPHVRGYWLGTCNCHGALN